MKKFNKIYKIQPREKRGRIPMVGFFVVAFAIYVGWSECCSTEPVQLEKYISQLVSLAVPLVPLHLATYLLHFHKAGYQLWKFNKFFSRVKRETKASVSVLVMFIFLLVVFDSNKLLSLFIESLAAAIAVLVFNLLKIHRNKVEDEETVEKAKHHVAPGLAMAFFRFIQNVVNGVVDEDGNEVSKPHEKALKDFIRENEMGSDRDWICEKILILFPESEHISGSVHDISAREKDKGENHCLTLEPLVHKYMAAGQPRTSVLNVIKIQDNEITTLKKCNGNCNGDGSIGADRTLVNRLHNRDSLLNVHKGGSCEKMHPKKEWQNNYVIFAENRPLNTLYQMVEAPVSQISFDRKDFELQFNLFYKELRMLIEKDELCKEKVELFKYQDYASTKGNFSSRLKKQIKEMKMRPAGEEEL